MLLKKSSSVCSEWGLILAAISAVFKHASFHSLGSEIWGRELTSDTRKEMWNTSAGQVSSYQGSWKSSKCHSHHEKSNTALRISTAQMRRAEEHTKSKNKGFVSSWEGSRHGPDLSHKSSMGIGKWSITPTNGRKWGRLNNLRAELRQQS